MEILKKQGVVLGQKLDRLYERIEYFPWTLHGRIEQVDVDYLRREQVQLEREICTMNCQICAPAGQWNPVGQAAAAFRDFITATDTLAGWNDKDHALFVKIRRKSQPHNLVDNLINHLPDKGRLEIEDHERWYARYVELREKQREELREWKLLRKTQVNRKLPSTIQQITFVHQWLKHRPQVRQKLNQWKEEKEHSKQQQQQQQQRCLSAPACTTKNGRPIIVGIEYGNLLRYLKRVDEKATKEAADSAAELMRRVDAQSRALIANRRIRDRGRRCVHQSRLQFLAKNQQKLGQIQQITGRTHEAPRDPDRIYRATSASVARTIAQDQSDQLICRSGSCYVLDIASRSVPRWRQFAVNHGN